MPPRVEIAGNAVALLYGLLILLFSIWPQATPVMAKTMNFSGLMSGATMLFNLLYYYGKGRKVYVGPVVETMLENVNQ